MVGGGVELIPKRVVVQELPPDTLHKDWVQTMNGTTKMF